MNTPPVKAKRTYRKIDKNAITRFTAEKALQGSGTRAIEVLNPDYKWPGNRASKLSKQVQELGTGDYVDQSIERIAVGAIDRVEEMVYSTDERIATKNAHFILEQHRGKAIQKTESTSVNLNIESVLA